MAKPQTPLAQALLAIASRPSTNPVLLERAADWVGRVPGSDELAAALVGNPSFPLPAALALCGDAGARTVAGEVLAALAQRPGLDDETLRVLVTRLAGASHAGSTHPLVLLATDRSTPLAVLRVVQQALLTVPLGRWHHTGLIAHPHADTDLVVAVLEHVGAATGTGTQAATGMAQSLWLSTLKEIPATTTAAACERVTHPVVLTDLVEATNPHLSDQCWQRVADVAVISSKAWPARRTSGAGKTHPLTRAVRILLDRGPLPVKQAAAAALAEGGVRILGQDAHTALGLTAPGERATGAVGRRGFRAVCASLSGNLATTDALGADLTGLDDAEWEVFCRLADTFPGTLDTLLDTCRGVAAPH